MAALGVPLMPDKCACPCLIATGELEHALYDITEDLAWEQAGDESWSLENGEDIPEGYIEEAHSALTKAEKECGYRSQTVRGIIREVGKTKTLEGDSPDAWRDGMIVLFLQDIRSACKE